MISSDESKGTSTITSATASQDVPDKTVEFSQVALDHVSLRFLIANSNEKGLILDIPLGLKPSELKQLLLLNWPPDEDVPRVSTVDDFRLFCMGKELITLPEALRLAAINSGTFKEYSLQQINIPKFPQHPTPVNIAVKTLEKKIEVLNVEDSSKNRVRNNGIRLTVSPPTNADASTPTNSRPNTMAPNVNQNPATGPNHPERVEILCCNIS